MTHQVFYWVGWSLLFPMCFNVFDLWTLVLLGENEKSSPILMFFNTETCMFNIIYRFLYVRREIMSKLFESHETSFSHHLKYHLVYLTLGYMSLMQQIILYPITHPTGDVQSCAALIGSGVLNIVLLCHHHVIYYNYDKYVHYLPPLNIKEHKCIPEECELCPCFICSEPIDSITVLKCGHTIHESCMRKWLNAQSSMFKPSSCPLCRLVVV
jgi:hypothetical protein